MLWWSRVCNEFGSIVAVVIVVRQNLFDGKVAGGVVL